MLARYHGTSRIKDRYFLSSGLLLFLFLSAGVAVIFVRGEAKAPGASAAPPEAKAESPETKSMTLQTQAKPSEAEVKVPEAKAEASEAPPKLAEARVKTPATQAETSESQAKTPEIAIGQVCQPGVRRSFFEMEFGTLAILPRATTREAANRAGTFLALQKYASYTIGTTHSPIWFQFNHYLPESDGQPRHLGALIIVVSRSAGCRHVEVYRNSGWTRPNSTEILGEFSESPNLSWEQFVALNRESTSDPQKLDDAYGGPWHAFPRGGRKYSWDYQVFWNWAVSEYEKTSKTVLGDLPAIDRYRVSARLLAYTPTPIPESKRPLVFYVHASPGDFMFVALYSLYNSGVDTHAWYWIQLK
jgi:hypothetical protein